LNFPPLWRRVEALELHRRQVDTQLSAAVQEAERIRRDSSSREAHLKGLVQSMGVANESMETKVMSPFISRGGCTAELRREFPQK
jgi:hypothetical protein